MDRFEQLVSSGQKTVQWLEKNSEISSLLLHSGAAMEQYDGLKGQDLLTSFSFSGDNGLIRAVSGITNETPVHHVLTSDSKGALFKHQDDDTQPADTIQAENRQRDIILPAGYESLPKEQIVQKVLDRVRQDMEIELPENATSRTQSSERLLSTEEKAIGPPPSITSGDARNQSLVFEYQDVVPDQPLISGRPVESIKNPVVSEHLQRPLTASMEKMEKKNKSNWLKKYPEHGHAAANKLSVDRDLNISVDTLRKWADPFSDVILTNIDARGSHKGIRTKDDAAVKKKRASSEELHGTDFIDHLALKSSVTEQDTRPDTTLRSSNRSFTDRHSVPVSNAFGSDKISHPVHAGQNEAKPFFTEKETRPSQLEQLVRKWEDNSSESITAGTGSGVASVAMPASVKRAIESKDAGNINLKIKPSLDSDQMFITTLERVLKREIRRHGMEEKE